MEIDDLTYAIVDALQKDCRQQIKTLAKSLSIAPKTLRKRMKLLKQTGVIELFTIVVDYKKLGYSKLVSIWIKVNPKHYDYFFEQIQLFDEITWINFLQGNFDFYVGGLFKTEKEFTNFIINRIGKMKGVESIKTELVHRHFYKDILIEEPPQSNRKINIDSLDLKILEKLKENATLSNEEIARLLDTTSRKIRYRLTRLINNNVIRSFTCITNLKKLGYNIRPILKLKTSPERIDELIKEFSKYKEVGFISQNVGYGKIQIDTRFHDQIEFQDFLQEKFNDFPINKMEVFLSMKTRGKYLT